MAFSIRLDEELEQRLDQLSRLTKRSKAFYFKEALAYYLDRMEAPLIEEAKRLNLNKEEDKPTSKNS